MSFDSLREHSTCYKSILTIKTESKKLRGAESHSAVLPLGTAHAKVLTPSVPVGICPLTLRLRKGEWVDKRLSHSLGRGSGTDSMKFFFNSLMLAWCFLISSWVLSRSYQQKDRVSEGTQRDSGLPKLCLAKLHSAELLTTSQTLLTLQTHKGSILSPPL